MPLIKSGSREAVSTNIKEMIAAGRPRNQAIAAALSTARRYAKAHGGSIQGLAFGGEPAIPFFARAQAYATERGDQGGPILSEVPGRTDRLPMSPAAGSYIIPADTMAGIGQDNSLAGADFFDKVFKSGPWGTKLPRIGRERDTIPRPPAAFRDTQKEPTLAKGGETKAAESDAHKNEPVPVIVAGGEYHIPAYIVAHHALLGNLHPSNNDPRHFKMALKRGHAILDRFVLEARKKHIKDLQKLPPPAK